MASDRVKLGTGRTGGREATTGVIPGRFVLSVGKPDLPSPPGWKWTALTSVAQLESGHTPSRRVPEYWDGEIPWIGIKDATANHGRTIQDTFQHVTQLGLENSSARLLPANTVCLSRTASVGFVVVMGCPMATSQDFVNWDCGPKMDPQFLKYVLIAENEALWRFASGTTHQTIYYPEAKAFHVCLPPIKEQKRIVQILGALDDKIELNRHMNATLEAMARALFQSWFVNFDPVRVKCESLGDLPNVTKIGFELVKADLFPGSFHETKLGPVPLGWQIGCLGDLCNLKRGHDLPTSTRTAGSIPVVSSSGISGSHSKTDVRGPGVVTGRYGTIGKVFYVETDYWPLNTTLYVEDFKGSPPRFIFHALGEVDFTRYTDKAAVPGVNRNHLHEEPMVIPPIELREEFAQVVAPLWSQHSANERQSRTLANLRDTLLPKLLSGEATFTNIYP